ncbi:MAG: hypothetical protein WBH60_08190, partial [Fervidobacterium sp.]
GWTDSFGAGGYDGYLLKLDGSGNLKWQKTCGGDQEDWFNCVRQTSDGGYIAVGWTYSYGQGLADVYVVKIDENGKLDWQKTYGGSGFDAGYCIEQTIGGGFIIVGESNSFVSGPVDVYIVKIDANGNLEWQETYGSDGSDEAFCIRKTSDGGYIIAGRSDPQNTGMYDAYILKIDENGALSWQKTYGGDDWDEAKSICQTSDGGYVAVGVTNSFGAEWDAYAFKIEQDGTLRWQRYFGGTGSDEAHDVCQTDDNCYMIAGVTYSFGRGGDVYLLKLDESGSLKWSKTYGGDTSDEANSIERTFDGGYIIAGRTDSFGAGCDDVYVLKIEENGTSSPPQ